MSLTYKELHRQLMYNPWTGYFYWKDSPSNKINFGDIAGHKNKINYIEIRINSQLHLGHRLAWFYVYGYLPEKGIDHEDQIRYHNWILNLREASQVCNMRNTGNSKANTSGVKGVCWFKRDRNWAASITIKGKSKFLGYYKDFDEAVCARLAMEQCLNWSNCETNSPAYLYVKENIQWNL